ncbi:MAG: pyruvate dehydrogenase (acetyl-transferring), homodimeric type [Planctomycetes bacterium GWF2_42_9]|nr:MAG: pyruvate dehydrogenase (acetyl-transferring), homodimeric type [Planctomycetes bacterium GWF2_42_9]
MADKNQKLLESEIKEWKHLLDDVYFHQGPSAVKNSLEQLQIYAQKLGITARRPGTTPYINTIPANQQPPYPGRRELEKRIKHIIRWNAMAMVVRANREMHGIGGHISTYASAATLYEVGFNHFFRAKNEKQPGDIIYFQGHASPGIYARAFFEGRISGFDLENYRRELNPKGGLPSYPHPRLMPDFWQFPTVSMGLSPLMAIYQARFNKYLENRGVKEPSDQNIWVFLGDGEMDEPESLGALCVAAREKLDNLIFVVNCNLQRLDGPVLGNGKIIQELESIYAGAGWNVIKVIWGSDWDPLIEKDTEGLLVKRMEQIPDGQFQKYAVSSGDYIRKDFFGTDSYLLDLVKNYSDEQIEKLNRGGHDPLKVYAAYKAAIENEGSPTVIFAQTIKGYGLGEAGEGRNITHQQKTLNEMELLEFRSRFGIPVPDGEVAETPFYRPNEQSEEMKYLRRLREDLGGYVPQRKVEVKPLPSLPDSIFNEFLKGSGKRQEATTMATVRLLSKLLKNKDVGNLIVPIVPDEARTFGMETLFRQVGIYSPLGQLYEPVDKESLLYYKELKNGAILEEGITEAGSMSSFIAAGTAYATHGINMIPFYFFYSIFGCQRMFDLIWAAADSMARGFLLGGIAGRTTLSGEGLQHQDGHSHHFMYAVPNMKAYDPAFSYEVAVIIRDGIQRMYEKQENIFYYLTILNEFYEMPAMPEMPQNVSEGIIKGMYKFKSVSDGNIGKKAILLASGAIINEAIKAQNILESKYGIAAEVWSVTSFKELYTDGFSTERLNMLNPLNEPKRCYIQQCFENEDAVFVAASDYLRALPYSIARWLPGRMMPLGTDGFGRSDGRAELRNYFEVDWRFITLAALQGLAMDKKIEIAVVAEAIKDFDIDAKKINPISI